MSTFGFVKSFYFLLILVPLFLNSQPLNYGKRVMDTLCHPNMHGRGYVKNGDKKAAQYIRNEFKSYDLRKFRFHSQRSYFQDFEFTVNTFPGAMFLKVDGKTLEPGDEYLVKPNSGGTNTRRFMGVKKLELRHIDSAKAYKKLESQDLGNKVLIIDEPSFHSRENHERFKKIRDNEVDAGALLFVTTDELIWGNSTRALDYPVLEVKKSAFPEDPDMVHLEVEQNYKTSYTTQNVVGYVEGRKNPRSYIVVTGHYDHLGRMGDETYFPGANDNASGISMLLNLARYFSKSGNEPRYSLVFIAFTGEEVGILGSRAFTQNPPFQLSKIKSLINIDLMGNGKKGMMMVNGKVHKHIYKKFQEINETNQYLPEIKKRGDAANSDHYFFHKAGVPAVFCYLMEDYPHYHNPHDKPEKLSLNNYEDTYWLFVDYLESFN